MKKLDALRNKVKEIDNKIIRLIGKRITITKKIGKKKKEKGIPLRNWKIEKSVIKNASVSAQNLGISQNLIKSIMQKLIDEARYQQEMYHYSNYTGAKENILIVGGLGEMGRWFSHFFQNQGHRVSIYDVQGKSDTFKSYESLNQGIDHVGYVLIATGLESVPEVLNKIIKLRFKGVVFDIASLKSYLSKAIQKANDKGLSITSIHPMFGPNTRTLSDKVMILCDCGNKTANSSVERFFKDTALSIVRLSLEEHDRVISYILGLSHITNIIFMKALMTGGYKYRELIKFASTTFLSQMVTASSVINENPNLYYEIQQLNPFRKNLFENLNNAANDVITAVLAGDKSSFIEIMEVGKKWLSEK